MERFSALCAENGSRFDYLAIERASKHVVKLLSGDASVSEYGGQGATLEFTVHWDDKRVDLVGMFQPDVAAALANGLPAQLLQSPGELRSLQDRKPVTYAGIGKVRRMTPAGSSSPSSRRPST